MKQISVIVVALLVFGCQKKESNAGLLAENLPPETHTELYGSWVGDFKAAAYNKKSEEMFSYINKINLTIKRISKDDVSGQTIVAGNNRPFKGKVEEKAGNLWFTIKEPGSQKHDGVFVFHYVDGKMIGEWTDNDPNARVTKREFSLTRKEFSYDPKVMLSEDAELVDYYDVHKTSVEGEDGEGHKIAIPEDTYRFANPDFVAKINASTTPLTSDQLKEMKKIDLEIIRNTIYARHGYSFKKRAARQFFDSAEWYIPVSDNVDDKLTELEKNNIVLLKKFEQYATDNYETYGR